jgi:hypothetical protein
MVVLIGSNGRASTSAECPTYDRPVTPPYLVAYEGAESAANRSADGGVQTLIVGQHNCAQQSGAP